jgi:hypothetical protein
MGLQEKERGGWEGFTQTKWIDYEETFSHPDTLGHCHSF